MTHNTLSASSILETLRSLEKNPFSGTNGLPRAGNSYRVLGRTDDTSKTVPRSTRMKTSDKEKSKQPEFGMVGSTSSSCPNVAMFVDISNCDSVYTPSISEENMPLLEKDNYSTVKSEALKSDRQRMLDRISRIEKKTERHLDDAVALIPAHYFVSHKMFDQIKAKALDSVWSILQKMRLRLLRQGVAIWHASAKERTASMRERSASILCRIGRGFLGRRRARNIHKRRLAEVKARSKTNAIALMNRSERVLLIQTVFRRWRVQKPYQTFIVKHRAALLIQHRYQSYRNEGRFYDAVQTMVTRLQAAKRIQYNFRGLLGRMRARARRSQLHRARTEARYATPEGVFEFYFEQNGAAFRIQRWYKNLWWVRRIKGNERREKRKRVLDGKARQIQRIIRGFLGRRRAMKQKEINRLQARVNLALIIRVQAVARRFLARRGNRLIIERLAYLRTKRVQAKLLNIGTRRNAISFDHLRIGTERNIMRMDRKARIIQKTYKSFRVLRYFSNMIKFRKVILVNKIQRWYRTWVWRHSIYSSLRIIQPLWRFKMHKYLKKKHAAIKIHNRYKTYRSMKWFHDWRRNIRDSANRLQQWAFHRMWARAHHAEIQKARINVEGRLAGEKQYAKTELFAQIDELFKRLNMTKIPLSKHEPQTVFMSYCPQGLLDMGKTFKMVKECPGLIHAPQLTMKMVEMIFAKVKGTSGRGLEYFQVVELLYYLASMRYHSIDASLLHNVTVTAGEGSRPSSPDRPPSRTPGHGKVSKKEESAAKRQEAIAQQGAIVAAERFGRYSGKKALTARIAYEFLTSNPVYKKAEADLDSKCAVQTAQRRVDSALYTLQRLFRYLIFINGLYRVRMMAKARKLELLVTESAAKIQAIMRGYLGRRAVVRVSQVVYMKFIDVDSGREFWSNTHLGTSHWVKPRLLRELDCGDGVKMPTPDEMYIPLCSDCNVATGVCFCDQCNRLFCDVCFMSMHKSGMRKLHDKISLEMCVECTFQVPTKQCVSCEEMYCDTCFLFAHRRGRARLHTFRWVTDHCDLCDERAAHWRRVDTHNRYAEEHLCTLCFKSSYGDPLDKDPTRQIEVYSVKYFGPTVQHYRKVKADAEAKRQAAEDYAKLVEETLKRRRDSGATTIQRVYRGVRVRREVAPFLEQRRVFLLYRQKEMPKRRALLYRARDVFGLAPSLKSDTNKEKVLRVFPKFLRPTVLDCVERKWGIYCKLLNPPDLGPDGPTPDKVSFGGGVLAFGGLMAAKFSLTMRERSVRSKFRQHQQARERYRAARSSATAKAERKKQLQAYAHDCLKRLEASKTKRDEELDNMTLARKRWEHFAGPRGLQNLVSLRRSEGVPMPFTVQLAAGSRYALVRYGVPSKDATADHADFPTSPGSWRKRLQVGDIIMLHGMHFRIVEGEDLLDILEEFEGGDTDSDDDADDGSVDDFFSTGRRKGKGGRDGAKKMSASVQPSVVTSKSGVSDKSARKAGKASKAREMKGEEGQTDDDVSALDDELDGDVETAGGSGLGLKKQFTMLPILRSASSAGQVPHDLGERGDDHIKLDRIWLFEDVPYMSVYRVAQKPAHIEPLHKATRTVHESWPVQKLVVFCALLLDKLSSSVTSFSKLFDEESETGASFVERGKRIGEYRDWFMKASRKNINFDFEFAIKKTIVMVFKAMYNVSKRFILSQIENYKKRQENAKMSPYRRWEMSNDKVEIAVFLESGLEDRTRLGTLFMDLDAPCDVLRVYIERNFRDELNEECGRAFRLFVRNDQGEEQLLQLEEEELKWSKDFALAATNAQTGVDMPTVTIVKNEGEEIDLIDDDFSDGGGFGFDEDEDDSDDEEFVDAGS